MNRYFRRIELAPDQRAELIRLRDNASKPYLRERASAILKIADDTSAAQVARSGLLRCRKQDTVRDWLDRYQHEGIDGLYIRPGRGRKPAFSP